MSALQYALSIVQHAAGHLTLLNVIEGYPEPLELVGFNTAELLRHLERAAREGLRQAVPEETRRWCKPEEIVAAGKPWHEILWVAKEQGTELIVIGVHGRNPAHLMLFGSTTHQVVREATCPVLTIRTEAKQDKYRARGFPRPGSALARGEKKPGQRCTREGLWPRPRATGSRKVALDDGRVPVIRQ